MTVTLKLTDAEARGLLVLADEGAEGLLTNAEAAHDYIGPPASIAAAVRALNLLRDATPAKARKATT
jgi:hypothetical protein